jgi:XapX domain-containing protein
MKAHLISLGAGLLIGIVYSLLHVRSPAPLVIALAGLPGMLAVEQVIPLANRYFFPNSTNIASQQKDQE